MSKMNKHSRRYYREIKAIIPSRGKYEKKLLKNYKQRIIELNNECSNITYDTLIETLNSPSEIINDYYSNVDTNYLIKRLRTTNIIRRCIYCILFLTAIGFAVHIWYDARLYHDVHNSIIVREKTIIY